MDFIFDFGNVIINLDFGKTDRLFADYLKPGIDYQFYKEEAQAYFYDYEMGLISTADFLEKLGTNAKDSVTEQQLLAAWNALLLDIPQARLDMLLDLRRKGHRTFLLSNTNEAHIENVRAYLKAERVVDDFEDRYFDTVFYSYEMKMRKPNDNIYEEVIQSAGIDLGNMVFFDDNELNIETAKKLGWNAVLHPIGAEITEAVAKVLT